jgi:ABC-type sugar transport system, ATPase component
MKNEILRMEHITKEYGGQQVLSNVNLNLFESEVLGIWGLNGAGKTTLMNILCGSCQNYLGTIYIQEQKTSVKSIDQANQNGIYYISDETELVNNLSIAENIFFIRSNMHLLTIVNKKKISENAARLMSLFNLDILPETKASHLTILEKHIIEICKAIMLDAKIIILDDITDSYSEKDFEILKGIFLKLKQIGISVIFVNHGINKTVKMMDRIVVLRSGKCINVLYQSEFTDSELISLLVGYNFNNKFQKSKIKFGEEILSLRNVATDSYLKDIRFGVRKGEIVGIIDWNDNSLNELVDVLFGECPITKGDMFIRGQKTYFKSCIDAIKNKFGLIPEGGINKGLYPKMNIADNISFINLNKISHLGYLSDSILDYISREFIHSTGDTIKNKKAKAMDLDDESKFDLLISKWLFTKPDILIWPKPTLGTDVVSKKNVFKAIDEMSDQGIAVIIFSANISEILQICDKMIIVDDGQVKGELLNKEIEMKNIIELANDKIRI